MVKNNIMWMKKTKCQMKIQKSSDFCLSRCRGQLKIKQMSFMLLAVVLFFIIVGLFFISFSFSRLKQDATTLNKENAIATALRLAGSPEFSCGKDYCISLDKAMALRGMSSYSGFWGVSSIEIWKLSGNRNCTISNYPDCDVIVIANNKDANQILTPLFVSLCRKEVENNAVYDKCELGKLLVGYKVE